MLNHFTIRLLIFLLFILRGGTLIAQHNNVLDKYIQEGLANSMNKLTQTNNFRNQDNQTISFLPNNFHDTKVHAVYPILNKT